MEVLVPDQGEHKDEGADAQHQVAENFAQLGQLDLKGGLPSTQSR